jgi:hypothetical protein
MRNRILLLIGCIAVASSVETARSSGGCCSYNLSPGVFTPVWSGCTSARKVSWCEKPDKGGIYLAADDSVNAWCSTIELKSGKNFFIGNCDTTTFFESPIPPIILGGTCCRFTHTDAIITVTNIGTPLIKPCTSALCPGEAQGPPAIE